MKGVEINKIGGQVDIMPTLAYLLGLDQTKYENAVMAGAWLAAAVDTTGRASHHFNKIIMQFFGLDFFEKVFCISQPADDGYFHFSLLKRKGQLLNSFQPPNA